MGNPAIKKISKVFTVTPTLQLTAYSANQILGGLQALPDFFDTTKGVSEFVSLNVCDTSIVNAALYIVFFGGKPSGSYGNGTTFSPSTSDLKLIQGVFGVASASYTSFSANSSAQLNNIRAKIQAAYNPLQTGPNSTALAAYAIIVTTGTPTYATANALQFQIGIEQDV
jgi:hypothetical protein